MNINSDNALSIAAAVRTRQVSAVEVTQAALTQITARNHQLNCFTAITAETALRDAAKIDKQIAQGNHIGLLAGVPFAVKNLYDIAGLTTLAGSKINAENPPARQDATAIAKLKQAGAVLVGALNMDEYAYGFVTENFHYGVTRNPHDLQRIAGGSSGGSAAAVAAGLVPLTLGSDTNGSIRVPAALCGVFGFKPTYGRLSRAGVALFSSSFDHIGTFARSVQDIATAFDILQGEDERDPICTRRPCQLCLPQLEQDISGIRIAIADDYFTQSATPKALAVVQKVAQALNVTEYITIPEAHRARAAAFVITASEGANLHLHQLKSRPQDFDPATRHRFLAGALIPNSWYLQAQRFRRWYRHRLEEVFKKVDIILAPTTPISAPLIGQQTMILDGEEIPVRPHLGLFTQPLSFIGLPVLSVPIQGGNALPLGVQLVSAPYNEILILQIAAVLESQAVTSAKMAPS
ncbi:AtzE family amidohydrolase [Umezakia ovalisporum]|uniref:AtzE family amidohydrolase n=1 Tax=Umezakia ovalisporum FSS-43 TaxID=2740520 RepID=A0ABT6K7L6_9CYAN|nr:AtzE family amidohydrolase [Umezakia ovalisporum]MDH6058161.1 AtzE family amidohydrolase [Umezakia ovalisporum FSS-43]MDH6066302.1 AtzE family amidohydrolase [Umezakia ovalisporum APH033B]MDH6071861.1 AtzE family amidohydrolase [Umezakia ovalisporum CobakiLakeA]MDH6073607.1 AtzE family amidohydrolase [Umezakia ovalisporum CS-1034]MDH6081163.1 AtzE family amidohydrolase [Umezakia ovalisporum FSS-44]